jgi:hypothetical protein
MPLTAQQKREEHRAFCEAAALAAERKRMKRAIKRLETAKRWVAQGLEVEPRFLSLSYHFDSVSEEDRKKREEKDARAVEEAYKKPRAVTGV